MLSVIYTEKITQSERDMEHPYTFLFSLPNGHPSLPTIPSCRLRVLTRLRHDTGCRS